MTNPLRGSLEITLAGEIYKVRLTIDAIVGIEQQVGCGIIKLAQKMSEGDISLTDILSVLMPALRGGGNDIDHKKLYDIVSRAGVVESATVVATLLASTITPQEIEEKSKKNPKGVSVGE